MSEEQIAVILAYGGKALRQGAMAASRIRGIEPGEAVAAGDIAGHSAYIRIGRALTREEQEAILRALPPGHEISVHSELGGVVIDVNPIFSDAGPVGISEADLLRALKAVDLDAEAKVFAHGYHSVYETLDEYDSVIDNFERSLRDGTVQGADGGGRSRDEPDPRRRLDDLARAKAALEALGARLDRDFRAFSERAERRASRRAQGVEPDAEARPDAAGPGRPPPARGPPDEEPDGEGGAGGPRPSTSPRRKARRRRRSTRR